MKYKINYAYDASGIAYVEAKSKEEAEEKFFDGECIEGDQSGENYFIVEVEKC